MRLPATALTRRRMLGLGAVLAGGAGLAAAPAAAAAAPGVGLILHCEDLRSVTAARAAGDPLTLRGTVVGRRGETGDFLATGTVVHAAHAAADGTASVQHHLFDLADGTLAATGTVDHSGRGRFTLTGTSGAYAGRSGSYSTEQHADAAGRGSAEFTFHFENTGRI